jgi:hypothetical protein
MTRGSRAERAERAALLKEARAEFFKALHLPDLRDL